jgi:hypothetical protein
MYTTVKKKKKKKHIDNFTVVFLWDPQWNQNGRVYLWNGDQTTETANAARSLWNQENVILKTRIQQNNF